MKWALYLLTTTLFGCGMITIGSDMNNKADSPLGNTEDGCPIESVGRLKPEGTCQSFDKEALLSQLDQVLENPSAYGFSQADVDAFLRNYGLEDSPKTEVLAVAERFIDEGYPHRHAATVLAVNPNDLSELLLTIDSPDGFVTAVTSEAVDIVVITDNGESKLDYTLKPFTEVQSTEPLVSFSFVLDYSGSMFECDLAYVELAIDKIINALPVAFESSLFKFNNRVCKLTTFTSDKNVFNDGLEKQISRSSTALFDGLVAGAQEMVKSKGRYRFVIGVTDGMENASESTLENVISALKDNQTTALMVGLGRVDIFNLDRIATGSHGYLFYVPASKLLERAADSVVSSIISAQVVKLERDLVPGEKIQVRYSGRSIDFEVPAE